MEKKRRAEKAKRRKKMKRSFGKVGILLLAVVGYLFAAAGSLSAETVTLDVQTEMLDIGTFEEITEARRGQNVMLGIKFNRLNSLGVPSEELIGKTMICTYTLSGSLEMKWSVEFIIDENNVDTLSGIGDEYLAPVSAELEPFTFTGKVEIIGLECLENQNSREYEVTESQLTLRTLTVMVEPANAGAVLLYEAHSYCTDNCQMQAEEGTQLWLYVDQNEDPDFLYWDDGTAHHDDPLISVVLDSDKTVTAVFSVPEIMLSISVEPAGCGTVRIRISGNDTICEDYCEISVIPGTEIELIAEQEDVFISWFSDLEGELILNPLFKTIYEDEEITAYFERRISSVDSDPLGDRISLILVHGNNSEGELEYGWKKFIKRAKKDDEFMEKFKMYLFFWNSEESNAFNGDLLGAALDSTAELWDEEVTILAHSRGGLVSRYFMNEYVTGKGIFSDQKGGERVKNLITLATPHRGSPGADDIWADFSFFYSYDPATSLVLSAVYKIFISKFGYEHSQEFILWDDANDELTDEEVCWDTSPWSEECAFLVSNCSNLLEINQNDDYLSKMIAFGGNEFDSRAVSERRALAILGWPAGAYDLIIYKHRLLTFSARLFADMPIIPNGYDAVPIDDSYRPFQANDGMVPLASALFLDQGAQNVFKVKKGKLKYSQSELDQYCQVDECIVVGKRKNTGDEDSVIVKGKVDHLDFLTNRKINKQVRNKLKSLTD